jgi:peptide subunit release factor 1 (eRF1)
VVDVQCGDENRFSQAIALAAPTLENVKNETEQKILDTFFSALAKNSGKVVYGEKETMRYLEAGAAESIYTPRNQPSPKTGTPPFSHQHQPESCITEN